MQTNPNELIPRIIISIHDWFDFIVEFTFIRYIFELNSLDYLSMIKVQVNI